MKLLSKREIDTAKASDRKRDYDEGKKLAARIDVLRETVANEEARLIQFRNTTVKEINETLRPLELKKDSLEKEVSLLEKRKKEALKPINAQIAKAEQKERSVASFEESLREERAAFHTLVTAHKQEVEALALEKQRIEDDRKQSKRILADAENLRIEAKITLHEGREKVQEMSASVDLRNKALVLKEQEIAARERDVSMREIDINDSWKEIEKERILLADRRGIVERTLKELQMKMKKYG